MSVSSEIKVLIVDDHDVVREGIKRIIELDKELKVIGEARNGEEAISKAVQFLPNVVVMDLKMPGMDGIAATREIKKRLPATNVLVLTLYAEDFIRQAIEAGASGYVLKESSSDQIGKAIHQVHEGLSPIDPALSRELVVEFAKLSRNSRSSVLTKRQSEILVLIADGISSQDIGKNLFISASTVKREMRKIFDKLGVNDRSHAVSMAIRKRII